MKRVELQKLFSYCVRIWVLIAVLLKIKVFGLFSCVRGVNIYKSAQCNIPEDLNHQRGLSFSCKICNFKSKASNF
jgi:hypothetical protein